MELRVLSPRLCGIYLRDESIAISDMASLSRGLDSESQNDKSMERCRPTARVSGQVGGTRLAIETEQAQRTNTLKKRADSQPSGARCVGWYLL